MEELEVKQEAYPAILDGYAKQGRMFLLNAAQNLIQYGRVLTEAKAVCRHGEFAKWVEENFGMKERSAQGYMAVWRRFGENESLNGMKFSNLQKMLALPEGAEEQFAKENDIENMTARQVAAAVAKAKEEAQRKLNSAMADAAVQLRESEAARKLAERRAEIAEQNAGENPEQAERIRLQQLVTRTQVRYINDAMKDRAREILSKKELQDDKDSVKDMVKAIKKAVLSRYGIGSVNDIPKHEYPVVMNQISGWNDLMVLRDVANKARKRGLRNG